MRKLLVGITLLALGAASAHSYLTASSPAEDSVVASVVSEIEVEFSEGVEVAFSTFKLVKVEHSIDLTDANYSARLNALAGSQTAQLLAERGLTEGEIELAVSPERGSPTTLTLTPAQALESGAYLLAWQILSVDTHVISGFLTFTVSSQEAGN